MNLTVKELFDDNHSIAWKYFLDVKYPWEILPLVSKIILDLGKTLDSEVYNHPCSDIWIAKSATVSPSVCINGPVIIGERSELRQCAFIRGSAIVGNDCVIGNSVEIKNSILFDNVQVPHFNYVGDSVLGYKAHMGAGSITSNVKSNYSKVVIHNEKQEIETGLFKMGAVLGDGVEVGCNAVLNPGTVIGKESVIYPCCSVRGVIPPLSICKTTNQIFVVSKTR